MTTSEIVRLNDQIVEAWNKHDTDKYLALCDDNIVWMVNKNGETYSGKNQVKAYFNNWKTAFPDLKMTVRNTIVGDDQIAVEYEFTGTHGGNLRTRRDLPSFSPTNKKATTYGCYTAKLKGDKIIQVANYPDRLALLDQLGLLAELHHEA